MKSYQKVEIDGRLYGWSTGCHAWTISRGGIGMPDCAGSRVTDEKLIEKIRSQVDIELCRVAAFFDGLRIIAAKEQDRGIELSAIPTEGIKKLQSYTVSRATDYAARNFPGLSFPDETERELIPFAYGVDADMSDESAELLRGTLDRNYMGEQ